MFILNAHALRPVFFPYMQEHLLFQLVFSVVDAEGVVVTIQSVNNGGDGRLLEVTCDSWIPAD